MIKTKLLIAAYKNRIVTNNFCFYGLAIFVSFPNTEAQLSSSLTIVTTLYSFLNAVTAIIPIQIKCCNHKTKLELVTKTTINQQKITIAHISVPLPVGTFHPSIFLIHAHTGFRPAHTCL